MLLKTLYSQRPLIHKNAASIYIYLRDHDQHINPKDSRLRVSYNDPKKLTPGAPAQKFLSYKLEKDMQELLDRQIFEEYKNKILRGIIDQVPIKQPDPLWGEEQVPTHYYYRPSKIDLMRVSHPHNADAEAWLDAHYQSYFSTSIQAQVDSQLAQTKDVHKLVEISVAARRQQITDKQIWYAIQEGFKRGKSLYLLSSEQLIKLKWAFDGLIKQGTPVFHEILSALLREDVPKMNKNQLLHLFYACRYSNPGQTNIQPEIIQRLRNIFTEFTFEQKTSFLLAYALCTKPLKLGKKVQRRRRYEYKQKAANVLLELDLWDLPLTNQTASQLIFALAKLHIENTKFITYPIRDFISENLQSFGQDLQRLYQAIVYLPQLEGGEGVLEQELATRLRGLAQQRWTQFSKIQQIRIIHSLWNLGLMDEGLLQLYKGVQFQADSSLLYYAAQIELHTSSERQWQIIQLLTALEHLPLPYYVVYKRFYNYIKSTTPWNLTPLADKLLNLQYHYNAMRQYDSLYKVRHYRKLRQFEAFSEVKFAQFGNPIQNLQLAHFAYPLHQVSLDIITKRELIPGTNDLKLTYRNKMRSLKNIGWKHIVFTEDQLKGLELFSIIGNVQNSYKPYVESQQAIIDYQDYLRAEQLEYHRQCEVLKQLEIDEINEYFSILEEKQNIILGNEAVDQEDQENSTERIKKGTPPPK